MKQRVNIDTSVFGGFFDSEFEAHTKPLFDRIKKSELRIIYSSVTEEELTNAPDRVKELVRSLPTNSYDYVEVTQEAIELAMT